MSKQLFIWIVLYFGGLAAALIHPIYPFVSYLTFYYAPPHFNWWGDMLPDMRFSLLASVVMLLSAGAKSAVLERVSDAKNPAFRWLLLFGLNAIIVTAWAEDRVRSWGFAVVILKLVLLYALLPVVVRTPAHVDLFSGVHIAGAAYWGYKGWDDPKREAGRLKEVGGPDTQNENAAAAHLLTVLPFVAVYALSAKRRVFQAVVLLCGAFIVNLIILCNSRGATVGLIAMAGAAIVLAGRGKRLKLLVVGAVCLASLYVLADPQFISRQQTTMDAEDGSAQGRLEAWQASFAFFRDYPLGTGGRGFHILSPRYIPNIVDDHDGEERSVHNTYLQLTAEWGIQGLLLWSAFIVSTFRLFRSSRLAARGNDWFFYRFLAVELALFGTLVAGIFTNRLYGESVYWMCALGFALHRIHLTATATEGEPAPAAAPATMMTAPVSLGSAR